MQTLYKTKKTNISFLGSKKYHTAPQWTLVNEAVTQKHFSLSVWSCEVWWWNKKFSVGNKSLSPCLEREWKALGKKGFYILSVNVIAVVRCQDEDPVFSFFITATLKDGTVKDGTMKSAATLLWPSTCLHLQETFWGFRGWFAEQSWDFTPCRRWNDMHDTTRGKGNDRVQWCGLKSRESGKIKIISGSIIPPSSEFQSCHQSNCLPQTAVHPVRIHVSPSCLGVTVDLIGPLGQVKSNSSTAEDPWKQYLLPLQAFSSWHL